MTAGTDRTDVILVVDDDEGLRDALELALQLENHPVALAADGVEALEWLHGHHVPSLILMDLMMPRMDGWQLFERLREDVRLAGVPIIVMTAFREDLGTVTALPLLKKPIDLDVLLQLVRSRRNATT